MGISWQRWCKKLAEVTRIDDRGRIKLLKGIIRPHGSVVITDARSFFLGIPISSDPLLASGSWLKVKGEAKDLKRWAEEEASSDATKRAARRGQSLN
jgi:hypothetical protein